MSDNPKKKWRLKSLTIEYKDFGEYKGKYVGKIKFENERDENFQFMIEPDMAVKYLKILGNDIIKSSEELTKELINTLPKQE